MIMPGRSWVAGIAIAGSDLLAGLPTLSEAEGLPERANGPKGQTEYRRRSEPNFSIL
jgi:hypothetical protein